MYSPSPVAVVLDLKHLRQLGTVFWIGVAAVEASGTGPFTAIAPVPAGDRWMYSNNPTPGNRATASTFSFLPSGGVDDRFGQFIIKFDTTAMGIPAGLGKENYDVHRLILTAIYASNDSVPYDPTEDSLASLGSAPTRADLDAGRPLELHGTGFRGGFTAATFQEASPYGSRNAFASSFDVAGSARDVSNNVTLGDESQPWAIGEITTTGGLPLVSGDIIPVYARVNFEINLGILGVADYVKHGLNQGFLWFTLSSFHPVSGPGSSGFPAYFTKEHPEQAIYQDVAPTLKTEYSLPLQIVGFQRDPTGNVRLTWNGSPGFQYTVESKEGLGIGVWSPLGTFTTATPASLNWSGNSSSSRAFFRVSRSSLP